MSLSKSSIISQQNLTAPKSENNSTYEFEDFRLDAAHLMLYKDGTTISLKPKTVETLVALVERRGEVVSKDELMNRLWADSFVEESNLTQNIYLLRKTLGNCFDGQPFIETFSRRGYRFNGEIKTQNGAELLFATHTKTQTVIEETIEYKTPRTQRSPFILGAIAACGLLVLSGFAFLNFKNTRTAADVPFQSFKLKRHSETGDVTSAKVSPDGKFIAYTDKKNALWLKNTATDSNVKVLPESEDGVREVKAISPDNNHIYFANWLRDKKTEIFKMSLFGGVQQKITEDVRSDLSLSPDGKQLSFVRLSNKREYFLIVANTDGTGERTITANKEGTAFGKNQSTAWSPDGSRIACISTAELDTKQIWYIRVFRVADGEEISVIETDSNFRWIKSVAWLPDGDNLLVIKGTHSTEGQIYKHTISSGEWQRVTNDLSDYYEMSVTANGKTVVTTQFEDPGNLWILPADGDSRQAKQITFGRNLMTDVTGVSWTPDGKIVYATNAGGKWEIWEISPDGTNQRQLTQNCAGNDSCSQPVVSPDGRYIVFQARRNGDTNIWRMDANGANAMQLTDDNGLTPSISPDGRLVIYMRRTPLATLWQIPIEGGKSGQFSKIVPAGAASISPDGKQMAFSTFGKQPLQTCVAPVAAEAPEKCFGISRSFPRWIPDGKAFYYLDYDYTKIWKQQLNGERELFLKFTDENIKNFAFSPDGNQLVVARSKPTQDIVALTDAQ